MTWDLCIFIVIIVFYCFGDNILNTNITQKIFTLCLMLYHVIFMFLVIVHINRTADNWWNRYKAEWIGDFFFYPLLQDALSAHVMKCIQKEYRYGHIFQNVTVELLYFIAIKQILHSQITFNRARPQPIILDRSFDKSECLIQFFCYLGNQHGVDWAIPQNAGV